MSIVSLWVSSLDHILIFFQERSFGLFSETVKYSLRISKHITSPYHDYNYICWIRDILLYLYCQNTNFANWICMKYNKSNYTHFYTSSITVKVEITIVFVPSYRCVKKPYQRNKKQTNKQNTFYAKLNLCFFRLQHNNKQTTIHFTLSLIFVFFRLHHNNGDGLYHDWCIFDRAWRYQSECAVWYGHRQRRMDGNGKFNEKKENALLTPMTKTLKSFSWPLVLGL